MGTVISLIALCVSVLNSIIVVLTFFLNRKDKSNDDTANDSYKWGAIDEKLSNIDKTLEKIEKKLENYDIEVDEKIQIEMKHHINEYHKKG